MYSVQNIFDGLLSSDSYVIRRKSLESIVPYLLKARIVKPTETAVARQWLSNRHVMAATIEELLEAVPCREYITSQSKEAPILNSRSIKH
jgi:hypothetical protein